MSILCNTQSIRDVIAFPKTSVGTDLLFKSPAPVDDKSMLSEYGICAISDATPKSNPVKETSSEKASPSSSA